MAERRQAQPQDPREAAPDEDRAAAQAAELPRAHNGLHDARGPQGGEEGRADGHQLGPRVAIAPNYLL